LNFPGQLPESFKGRVCLQHHNLKLPYVRTVLIILSIVFLLAWFFSVFFFALGQFLHMLLLLAIVTFVLSRRKSARDLRRRRKQASQNELE
jgi:ABC-type transport system involved in cytochrome bd biosynthesis fused ATPase/permease subunit